MRMILATLILIASFSQTGCSRNYSYYILNTTEQSLVVEISFKKRDKVNGFPLGVEEDSGFCFVKPILVKIENLADGKFQSELFVEGQMTRDRLQGKVILTLMKGQGVRVQQDFQDLRREFETEPNTSFWSFPFQSFSLRGINGKLEVEGKQALRFFSRNSNGNYQVVY